jgi:hypothetical protein
MFWGLQRKTCMGRPCILARPTWQCCLCMQISYRIFYFKFHYVNNALYSVLHDHMYGLLETYLFYLG